jgi:hypothetical protein
MKPLSILFGPISLTNIKNRMKIGMKLAEHNNNFSTSFVFLLKTNITEEF